MMKLQLISNHEEYVRVIDEYSKLKETTFEFETEKMAKVRELRVRMEEYEFRTRSLPQGR